ncbi:MAG TPA: hypothetical protein VGD72_06305 [Mycobacteriales bacterium]
MSFRDDITLACQTALRARPWPPSSGELDLLRRAASLPPDERAEGDRTGDSRPERYPRVARAPRPRIPVAPGF